MKNYIKFLFFIVAAIIGGNLNFNIIRIILLIIMAIILIEVIYKIDKYFTKKIKSRE